MGLSVFMPRKDTAVPKRDSAPYQSAIQGAAVPEAFSCEDVGIVRWLLRAAGGGSSEVGGAA